jgi:hypothetical protein
LDAKGEYASADTVFIFDFKDPWNMYAIAGILNSSFMDRVYRTQFAGLNMPGEWYQFQAPQIRLLPLPELNDITRNHLESVGRIANGIFEILYENFSADISVLQAELDEAVFRAYGIDSKQ